jgi:hypothetical protein
MGLKQVRQARDAVITAAGDTRQAMTLLGAVAVVALLLAAAALTIALRGRTAARA